jgi:hypothetical protein
MNLCNLQIIPLRLCLCIFVGDSTSICGPRDLVRAGYSKGLFPDFNEPIPKSHHRF